MKILITGASGFVGSNFCQYINDKGIDLIKVNRENGFDLSKRGWTHGIKTENIDTIIHMAQSSNHRDFEHKSEEIFDIDGDSGEESSEVEDAVIRIEDKLDELMADFDEIMADED